VRVLVGGLLRNGEAAVGRITQLALDLQREFGDVIVHVFENNSTDDTPALLMQAAREQPNLFARCEVWDIQRLPRVRQSSHLGQRFAAGSS